MRKTLIALGLLFYLVSICVFASAQKAQFIKRYEAENAVIYDEKGSVNALKAEEESDVSGGKYTRYYADIGDSITFNIDAPEDGEYLLLIRYAMGERVAASTCLYVNGVKKIVSFSPTFGWLPVHNQEMYVSLKKGGNTLKFVNEESAKCTVNFDFIDLYTKGEIDFFYNPVTNGADPYVYKHTDGDYYYCAGGGEVISIRRSKELYALSNEFYTEFVTTGKTFYFNGQMNILDSIWAPEVHYLYDSTTGKYKWYIYFCAKYRAVGQDKSTSESRRMFVLESENGKDYEFKAMLTDYTHDLWGIDATVMVMPDGKQYYVWSGTGADGRIQVQNIYIAPMENPYTLNGKSTLLSTPTFAWETRYGSGPFSYINEGPQILVSTNDVYNIVYSGSGSWCSDYALGTLTCINNDDVLNPKSWVKTGPYLSKYLYGVNQYSDGKSTGHASFTTSPRGNEYWVLYHARSNAANENTWVGRRARLQQIITADDGTPIMGFPTSSSEQIKKPDVDTIEHRHGYLDSWLGNKETGSWDVSDSRTVTLKALDESGKAQIYYGNAAFETYALSADITADGKGRYGVYAVYVDNMNYVLALIDTKNNQFSTYAVAGNEDLGWKHTPIEVNNSSRIKVEKGMSEFKFYYNGMLMQERTIDIWKGQFGLYSDGVDNISFANITQDNNMGWGNAVDTPGVGSWVPISGYTYDADGKVTHGAGVYQQDLGSAGGIQKELFIDLPQSAMNAIDEGYTTKMEIKEIERGKSLSKFGFYPYYKDKENYFLIYLNPVKNRVDINCMSGGLGGWQQSVPLKGINYAEFNKLAVQKNSDSFEIFLNDISIGKIYVQLSGIPTKLGVATVDSSCEFKGLTVQ